MYKTLVTGVACPKAFRSFIFIEKKEVLKLKRCSLRPRLLFISQFNHLQLLKKFPEYVG